MKKFVVRYVRIPTNFNPDMRVIVEANSPEDAAAIVRDHVGDNGPGLCNYVIDNGVPYTPPPAGRIVGTL
jgi:hypothetical protein